MSGRTCNTRPCRSVTPKPVRKGRIAVTLLSLALALLTACSGARNDDEFRLFVKKADASPVIWPAFSPLGAAVMADPGEPCELGCVVSLRHPRKCLLFGGENRSHVFLVYREGTVFLRTMLVVFELQGAQAGIAWQGDLSSYDGESVPGLRRALEEGVSRHRRQAKGASFAVDAGAWSGSAKNAAASNIIDQQCEEKR